jgi:hypothetical protein
MTTLHFETEDEDDLQKTGFSKDGKHQCPKIFLGLLVGNGGKQKHKTWDGIKGYLTKTTIPAHEVIANYRNVVLS